MKIVVIGGTGLIGSKTVAIAPRKIETRRTPLKRGELACAFGMENG